MCINYEANFLQNWCDVTYDANCAARGVIYDRNTFIVLATGLILATTGFCLTLASLRTLLEHQRLQKCPRDNRQE